MPTKSVHPSSLRSGVSGRAQSKRKTFVRKKTPVKKSHVRRVVKKTEVLRQAQDTVKPIQVSTASSLVSETQEMLSAVSEPVLVANASEEGAEETPPLSNAQAAALAAETQEAVDLVKEDLLPPPVKKSIKTAVLLSVIAVVVLLLLGAGAYLLLSVSKPSDSKNPQDIVSRVGHLVLLPMSETPTVALVTDVNKLPRVPLFANAKNGDRVLIYTTAKRAYLYRPSVGLVVAMSDVSIQTQPAAGTTTQGNVTAIPTNTPTPAPINVAIYNGTSIAGLAKTSSKALTTKDSTVSVVLTGDANKKPYAKTIVVDLTDKNLDRAAALAKLVGGTISTLPVGETSPNGVQFLIIIGADYSGK